MNEESSVISRWHYDSHEYFTATLRSKEHGSQDNIRSSLLRAFSQMHCERPAMACCPTVITCMCL